MDDMVKALTVPFAAGFVVQRLLEIVDPITSKLISDATTKKIVLGLVSLAIGFVMAVGMHLEIFHQLSGTAVDSSFYDSLDYFATAVFISAGTEGFNSLMKFANYKKESAKADSITKKAQLTPNQLPSA